MDDNVNLNADDDDIDDDDDDGLENLLKHWIYYSLPASSEFYCLLIIFANSLVLIWIQPV